MALLHDVMEDHPEYEEDVKKAVFSSKVIEALSILNRNSCENAKQIEGVRLIEGIRLLDKPNTLI